MKIVLVADISANGRLLLTDNVNHPVPETTVAFYIQTAIEAGCLIIGRKTFEVFEHDFGGVAQLFPGTEIVVLSQTTFAKEGVTVMQDHKDAIDYLRKKGFQNLVVGGGTQVYNLFINDGLLTDIYFNYVPVIVGDGGVLGSVDGLIADFRLAEHKIIDTNILQVHYTR